MPYTRRRSAGASAAELAAPFVLEGASLDVEASIGIAVTPEHGTDFEALLQHADVAMYVAKKAHLGAVGVRPGARRAQPDCAWR